MSQRAEIIDPGFSVADAHDVVFRYDGENLLLRFRDWRETIVHVVFENTIGFGYRSGEGLIHDGERFDACHLIRDSEWLLSMQETGEAWEGATWSHYKLNFNEVGVLEVLCTGIGSIEESTTHG